MYLLGKFYCDVFFPIVFTSWNSPMELKTLLYLPLDKVRKLSNTEFAYCIYLLKSARNLYTWHLQALWTNSDGILGPEDLTNS